VHLMISERILQPVGPTQVIGLVGKTSKELRLSVDMHGSPLQRRVWEKLRAIPAGSTVAYVELACWISPLLTPRAVAGACAANPIALATAGVQ
jgi:AraC family transcriptional regulator, regulatory protein of adaptative response / methylated-DNA-[protein]-cysteine methyltransferase